MTTVQMIFAAGVAAGMMAITWFAVRVISKTIKVDNARGVWRAVKQSVLGPGMLMDRGQLAYCCHRVSGVAIFAFLCLHILNVSMISVSHEVYNEIHAIYSSAPMQIMESVLLLAIIFHALNGLRLIVLDLFVLATKTADRLLSWVFALSLIGGLSGACVILAPVISWRRWVGRN
jgi:succinate dehydrogenase / fumarate reductase cytochrome b subunit